MSDSKPSEPKPNLRTKFEDFSGTEKVKLAAKGLTVAVRDIQSRVNLHYQLRDRSTEDIVEEAETLAKSCGIYLEFDRAKRGSDRDWMYMIRITVPGGGPITREQWTIMDDIAEKYSVSNTYTGFSKPSLRLTTRQNIQIHWIKKRNLVDAVREIAKSGFYTLNGCGDNVRNVMGCPLSHTSHDQYNANAWAQKAGKYFKLPTSAFIEIYEIDPTYLREAEERGPGEKFEYGENLLNRKFKIAFSTVHFDHEKEVYVPDNCVELRTNDIGIAPLVNGGDIERFQVYIGGSQGEKKGHPTFSALGQPLGIFREDKLLLGLDAIVKVHRDWGDRQNRQWARMKYVLYKMGMAWYRQQVRDVNGIDFEEPITNLDYGARNLHQGWRKQPDGSWCYGAFLENGRIIDGPNGQLKTMVRYLIDNYPVNLLTTPNQDLLFSNVPHDEKERFEADLKRFGYGSRNGKPYSLLRSLSGACVGRDTCRLTYTDSEKFVPYLIDELETKWGDISESIGITGCERQCFRPATKTIGWVGSGLDQYQLKIGGSEDGRNLGAPLADPENDETYLTHTPRKDVAIVTDALFEFYMSNRQLDEGRPGGMGYFFRRIGMKAIIRYLKENRPTFHVMAKPVKSQFTIKPTIPQ